MNRLYQDHTGQMIAGFLIIRQDSSKGNPWRASCGHCGHINLMPRRYVNKMARRGGECRKCGIRTKGEI